MVVREGEFLVCAGLEEVLVVRICVLTEGDEKFAKAIGLRGERDSDALIEKGHEGKEWLRCVGSMPVCAGRVLIVDCRSQVSLSYWHQWVN